MDANGMSTVPDSRSMRMSPGSRPNQLNSHGAQLTAMPASTRIRPISIKTRPIIRARVQRQTGLPAPMPR